MGYALSMGSIIMLAADTVEMAENALVMIHRAQGGAWGDAKAMRQTATVLEKHEAAVTPAYLARMHISETALQTLLQDETWYTAAEAKAAGLVDVITDKIDLSQAEADLTADAWEFAAENFKHPPVSFASRFDDHRAAAMPFVQRILHRAVGQPLPNLMNLSQADTEEIDMPLTPEDYAAIATAVVTALDNRDVEKTAQAAKAQTPPITPELEAAKAAEAALQAKLTAAEAETAALKQQVAELSKPVGATQIPINTGSAGDNLIEFEG